METKPNWYILIIRDGSKEPKVYNRDWRYFRVYNRFDKPYVKRVLRRFRILEYLCENHHFIHIVLTVKHLGNRGECCKKLITNWNRLRSLLIKHIGYFKFIRVLEAHHDGYPHMHILLFTKKYVIKQRMLSSWCEKYGLGKVVWIKRYWAGRYYKRMPVAYLSKYLSKQFKRDEWDDGMMVLYAILWKYKIRTYSFSNNFADMKPKNVTSTWKKVAVGEYDVIMKIIKLYVEIGIWVHEAMLVDRWR